MQSLIRSKSAGVTGGRGTAGAGPGRDLLYLSTYGTQNKECTSPEMALWRLSDHGAVFQLFFQNISAIFVNMQSDLT